MMTERATTERIVQVLQKVSVINQALSDVLLAEAGDRGAQSANHLRELAHGLVALGATVTSLGVEMAADVDKRN